MDEEDSKKNGVRIQWDDNETETPEWAHVDENVGRDSSTTAHLDGREIESTSENEKESTRENKSCLNAVLKFIYVFAVFLQIFILISGASTVFHHGVNFTRIFILSVFSYNLLLIIGSYIIQKQWERMGCEFMNEIHSV